MEHHQIAMYLAAIADPEAVMMARDAVLMAGDCAKIRLSPRSAKP
ncbi:hypothetical protein [Umezawaea sp. Da 62-37]|nr:hypothetical protein [Umezawaea sp. Da 62-37]WNV85314.1 hypothetical protein RM788_45560 [Umezawaea sp. Da 62-37]